MLPPTFVKKNQKTGGSGRYSVIQESPESIKFVDSQPDGEPTPKEKDANTHA